MYILHYICKKNSQIAKFVEINSIEIKNYQCKSYSLQKHLLNYFP